MTPALLQKRLSQLQSADDLRLLFADLSYEADFSPVFLERQTKGDEAAAESLAEAPQILSQSGDFKIIYAPLLDWNRALSSERLVISRLQNNFPRALWVFSDAEGKNWHLVNVKKTGVNSRSILRRFSFQNGQLAGRTSVEQLLQIDLLGFIGTDLEIQARHDEAFDVEAVTKKFFGDFKVVFEKVEANLRGIVGADDGQTRNLKRDWTQRLFNRLMFLRFVEKKGWLSFHGDKNYLRALWKASQKAGDDFLNDRLYFAFFWGLGLPGDIPLERQKELEAARGEVPFLNGGLFESFGSGDERGAVFFADQNAVFTEILGLFERYNFTVTESTSFDAEVGVDPEMLGKVFEELVTGRHESGSYYTPRGIVSFMAREALKGYLGGGAAIEKFVDEGDAGALSDPEAVLAALREVLICDPACGSGAYLLGAMQELLRLRETLFAAKARDHRRIYDRKLEIIARNLYGVDLDPFAVNIAMLRLWLSLVVEFEGETPPPLPNLKYKIEVGDSLAAPLGGQLTLDGATVSEFNHKKAAYLRASGNEKKRLESEIETLRAELRGWSQCDGGFDWRIEFAEVFSPEAPPTTVFGTFDFGVQLPSNAPDGGFDIVLANPPYIRQELIKDQKSRLKSVFGAAFSGTADLYVYFYLRGFELLKDGGQLAFISPNKWFRAAYGEKLRAHFAQKSHVQTIVDFGDLQVFQSATAYPMVFVAQKGALKSATNFTLVKSLAAPYPDVLAVVKRDGALLPPAALDGTNWHLNDAASFGRLETMRKSGLPLGEYVKGQIFRGVLTGFNEAFVIDEATRLN